MARRTTFKLPGLRTWVENIKNTVSEEAARQIVTDLKEIGPYWTGEFESAWVVRSGDVSIAANRPGKPNPPKFPQPRQLTSVTIPRARGRKSISYTIGNAMSYRNVALDLEPGRIKGGGNETAVQDWYAQYIEGGNLRLTLEQTTARVAADPRIRGFRGRQGEE
jgi:hypothetical protein